MTQQLTIIQQNDTHGCLELHNELYWSGSGPVLGKAGGFSRISHYVKKVKRENPNVLFFDGGDLFHGTLPLVASKGEAILPILEKMELDGFVPGNWDFAYGKGQLRNLVGRLPFPTIACNVTDDETGRPVVHPSIIKEMKGLKVGVVGLTYPYVDKTMPGNFSEGLSFSIGVEKLRGLVETLKGQVDLIILLSHMGLPLDAKVASLVSGIDIILSGHSHDRVKEPIVLGDTLIVQAGSSSSFLGRLDVTLDNGKITNADYQLIAVDESFEEDEETKQLVQAVLGPYERERNEVVGETNIILHRMTLNEAPMDRLITDAYRHSFDCDLAFSHGWRYGPPMARGPLALYDLHTIIPTNPELFTMEMDGKTLLETLENNLEQVFSADPFEQKGGYILRSSGLFMTFKPYNPKGRRIQSLLVNGSEIDMHKVYKIAGGGRQLFKGHENKKTYQGEKAVGAIHAYLKDKGPFQIKGGDRIISV